MRPVINVTTRKDGDKYQTITNINHDPNMVPNFLKNI